MSDAGKMVAEPCEMGAICLNCQPRGPNGECPDAPQPRRRLTDEEIIRVAVGTKSAEPGRDGYVLPISFARAIEAAVWGEKT